MYTAQTIDIEANVKDLEAYFGKENFETLRNNEGYNYACRVTIDGVSDPHYVLGNSHIFYSITNFDACVEHMMHEASTVGAYKRTKPTAVYTDSIDDAVLIIVCYAQTLENYLG